VLGLSATTVAGSLVTTVAAGWQLTRTIFDDDSGRFHVGVTISY
jgi:hypothetical protein